MERTRQILNKELTVTNVNNDTYLKINVENSQKLLPLDDVNKIVNVAERFNIERNRCKYYRIIGTINPTISNPLFNLSNSVAADKYTWSWFNSVEFLDTSYPKDNDTLDDTDLTYTASIKNNLKEKDGWFGAFDPDITKSGLCNFLDVEPKRERFSFIPDKLPYNGTANQQPVKNWELTITYPHATDKTHNMVANGLLITSVEPAIVSTKSMTAIGLSCRHNLAIGDIVRITGTTGLNGDFVVVRTGLDNGDYKDYYFVIDASPNGTISANSRIKKVINDIESQYYFRLFKKIKTRVSPVIENDDYETYNLAFSENFFTDTIIQFVFNEDIDVSELTDNLGRPLSEIYLTIIKTDSNRLFTSVSAGIETPYNARLKNSNTISYLRNIPSIHRIHNGGSTPFTTHTPLETNVQINNSGSNNLFYGDLVEYNENVLLETVLADVVHSFNTISRETKSQISYVTQVGLLTNSTKKTIDLGPRYEGYYYKPHHKLKIREFSTYIEYGDAFTEGIPSYATSTSDGGYVWRDLLDLGVNQSEEKPLDYPFLNNAHYLHQNFCFNLKRQDPFAMWGLYYGKFPEDPVGDKITDKFDVKEQDDVC